MVNSQGLFLNLSENFQFSDASLGQLPKLSDNCIAAKCCEVKTKSDLGLKSFVIMWPVHFLMLSSSLLPLD